MRPALGLVQGDASPVDRDPKPANRLDDAREDDLRIEARQHLREVSMRIDDLEAELAGVHAGLEPNPEREERVLARLRRAVAKTRFALGGT